MGRRLVAGLPAVHSPQRARESASSPRQSRGHHLPRGQFLGHYGEVHRQSDTRSPARHPGTSLRAGWQDRDTDHRGHRFYGKPTITSNEAGTRAVVTHDSGKLLTVRVTVRAGSRKGKHTFTIARPMAGRAGLLLGEVATCNDGRSSQLSPVQHSGLSFHWRNE